MNANAQQMWRKCAIHAIAILSSINWSSSTAANHGNGRGGAPECNLSRIFDTPPPPCTTRVPSLRLSQPSGPTRPHRTNQHALTQSCVAPRRGLSRVVSSIPAHQRPSPLPLPPTSPLPLPLPSPLPLPRHIRTSSFFSPPPAHIRLYSHHCQRRTFDIHPPPLPPPHLASTAIHPCHLSHSSFSFPRVIPRPHPTSSSS